MGILKYEWQFEIAPAPITIGYQSDTRGGKHRFELIWGRYVKERNYSGINYPKVGEVVEVPDFGKCKIERLIPLAGNKISRNSDIRVIISWKSIGNKNWWDSNVNSPTNFGWQALKIGKHDLRIFSDLDIPEPKEIKVKKETADKVRLWGDEKSKVFDPNAW